MCFLCDGGTADELERAVAADIIHPGWHVAGVEHERTDASWAYTIGLLERTGHPELIATGFCCGRHAMACVDVVAATVRGGARYRVGDEVQVDGEQVVRFGRVHPAQWRTDRFNGWLAHYEGVTWARTPEAVQLIVIDRHGRWPDDPSNRAWRHHRLDRPPQRPASRPHRRR